MKTMVTLGNLFLVLASAPAATLGLADVEATSIDCLFSATCTVQAEETLSPLMLPGTTGSGYLQTRTFAGETNSLGEGLYVYEYRIDLTGLTATNVPPCFTNVTSCFTNRVQVTTNTIICTTNAVGNSNMVVCVTNRFGYLTNLASCYTNLIPCPETTPCLDSLRLRFGPADGSLNFATGDVATAQVYIITSGGSGTIAPAFVRQDGDEILIQFAQPICPGESSYAIGLVSTTPPSDARAELTFTSGDSVSVDAQSPMGDGSGGTDCDLSDLEEAIACLRLSDIVAQNNHLRACRRDALVDLVEAASEAAEAGEVENVIEAVKTIADKADGQRNSWLTRKAAQRLAPILKELLDCLEDGAPDGGHDCDRNGDDQCDNDDNGGNGKPNCDADDDDASVGKGKKNGNGHQAGGKPNGPPGKSKGGKGKGHRK